MNYRTRALAALAALALAIAAFAPAELWADEQKALTQADAQAILQSLVPGITVISFSPSQIEGLWEVAFESRGEKGVAYLDAYGKKLVLGQIIDLATKQNHTKDKMEEISKVNFSDIPLEGSIVLGKADAKHKVVVFDDPE